MPKKHTFDYVFNYFKEQNCKLLSTEYVNNRTKLDYICSCGNKTSILFCNFKKETKCRKCNIKEKYTFEYVFNYFKEQNCELISKEYINATKNLNYLCKCGNKSEINFSRFKKGIRCLKCGGTEKHTFEYVFNYFKEQNCKLLSTEYINAKTKMNYICICGNASTINFNGFQNGNRCKKCSGLETHTFEYIQEFFWENECELLSTEYINNHTKLDFICSCGTKHSLNFKDFKKGRRCLECGFKKAMKSPYYYKDYTFPSGKIIRIQGYEHFALDELIKDFTENQILTDRKDMPVIKYIQNGSIHTYYPDIYIPHLNKIIEVKSTWTFEKKYCRNMLKSLETKKKYLFEFWIFDRKGNKVIV